jgi:hypothetical protein
MPPSFRSGGHGDFAYRVFTDSGHPEDTLRAPRPHHDAIELDAAPGVPLITMPQDNIFGESCPRDCE